jgi:hypothetical protein
LGSDASTSFATFGPASNDDAIIAELTIVMKLRQTYSQDDSVRFVSTVGSPLATSIYWILQSQFFIAPWGAALAKYRWVCNKPGFVVTNRFNISGPTGDLGIYHEPEFMENPSPMKIIPLDGVLEVPGSSGFYANFSIDPAALSVGLDWLIKISRVNDVLIY